MRNDHPFFSVFVATRVFQVLPMMAASALLLGAEDDPGNPPPAVDASSDLAPSGMARMFDIPTLSSVAALSMHHDGTSDSVELEALLHKLSEQIASTIVLKPEQPEAVLAAHETPLGATSTQWQLWVFWAMDIPTCNGLANALLQVRASGLAVLRPVHLASLRNWEEWLFIQNDHREHLLAALRHHDQQACTNLSSAWLSDIAEFRAMAHAFYASGGVQAMSGYATARLLRVENAPCFRLISPQGHVHALEGFGLGVDLVDWISRCHIWEAKVAGSPPE